MAETAVNRLAVTIVDGSQSRQLLQALAAKGFHVTTLDAVGGFLHDSLVTLLVGTAEEQLQEFFALIRKYCPRRTRFMPMGVETGMTPGYPMMIEVHVGGASVFVVPVEHFAQL
ncbi:MAG: cyclic-di-AMP receptor [Anaerolineae bacterium]|nr:cyclic-di-AMP receptor [Anaerolineae bacterium]HOV47369.1 cyclic-di-AMP receptor [Anaerolineae bacterium]HPD40285.1 cyclic-di-AMP receptor [Anaerolineae bacterium]HXK44212.1 cyclic-di-AMP receptor [Anaerolineae bacterium]